jgi:hypothetical protein
MKLHNRATACRRGQVLIILASTLLLGGSAGLASGYFLTGRSTSTIEDAVKKAVRDEGRRKAAVKVVERWEEDGRSSVRGIGNIQEKLLEQLAERQPDRSAIEALVTKLDDRIELIQRQSVDHRFALREQMTPIEWKRIFLADG